MRDAGLEKLTANASGICAQAFIAGRRSPGTEAKTEGEGELAVSKSEGQGSAGATGERIRFIDHQDKKILLVDFSNCSASEVERISRTVPDYVTVQPRGSVLILTDFSEASFDRETLRTMKETAVFDKQFVKKSALIGTASLPKEFYEQMKSFSRRELPIFATREEALAWLVEP
jgi:hypothetical protein